MRPLKIVRPYLRRAEGSCLFVMGETRVLCAASVEDRVPPHAEKKGMGWVTAEYAMLPRSTETRTPRSKASGGGRSQEISRLIGRSLRAVVDLSLIGPRMITIDCDVLQADAGTRTAAINGGFIALVDALRLLYKRGDITEWPVKDFLAAVSVASHQGRVVLDPTYEIDAAADVDMNIVMTGRGDFVEIQGAAEGRPFSSQQMAQMLAAARRGINAVVKLQKKTLGKMPVIPAKAGIQPSVVKF
jgi:ribonuclease PH